jgi:hypothetical protein
MNIYQHRRRYTLAFLVTVLFTITESIHHSNRDVASTLLLFATASFMPLAVAHLLDIIAEERHGTK